MGWETLFVFAAPVNEFEARLRLELTKQFRTIPNIRSKITMCADDNYSVLRR